MMLDLIIDILLIPISLGATILCGAPLVFGLSKRGRLFTKLALSFVAGYVAISLSGIVASLMRTEPILLESAVILAGAALALCYRGGLDGELDREDWTVIGLASLYLLIWLLYFDHIRMWMGGDAVAHASVIRVLLDGKSLPVSLPPFGSYWEYYPKAFHLYAYPWARIFPMLNVIQAVPVLITAVTSVLLYAMVRELERPKAGLYAFALACFAFPAHYSYLIWAGYPTAAAEMIMVATVLAVLVERRLLPLLLLGILFTHPRVILFAAAVLLAWAATKRLGQRHLYALAISALLLAAGGLFLQAQEPSFILSVLGDRELAGEYAARWFPAFLSLFGGVMALYRWDRLDRLAVSWTFAILSIVLLADMGILKGLATPDRAMLSLYLPLSILGGSSIAAMDPKGRFRGGFLLLILIVGGASMGAVLYSYAGSWALPEADYQALSWLGEQNYSNAVLINLDETGAWAYPMMGVEVALPRLVPSWRSYYSYRLIRKMLADPNRKEVLEALKGSGIEPTLIYISNTTISRPGHPPPFAESLGAWPVANLSFSRENYRILYSEGAFVYQAQDNFSIS